MKLKPIKTEQEYQAMLDWVDTPFDTSPDINSPDGEQLQIALLLIKAYEEVHYQIPTLNSSKLELNQQY
jgi:HTH-type transcriptional regulator / antitoxin HigA